MTDLPEVIDFQGTRWVRNDVVQERERRLAAAEALLREILEKEESWNAVPKFDWLKRAKEVCGE
jgi:hypothetical protein